MKKFVLGVALVTMAAGCGRNKNGAGDIDDIGSHASMAIDAEGRLHVTSYWKARKVSANRDEDVGALVYAKGKVSKDGTVDFGGWKVVDGDERREGGKNVGLYTSLALDKAGNPHVAYYDKSSGDLKYARLVADEWEIETVDSAGNVGGYASLVLENGELPRIAYYDFDLGDLKFAARSGASWNVMVVDGSTEYDAGKFASLASDGNGGLAIAFYDATNGDLGYVTGTASGFGTPEWIDTAGDVGKWPSLAFDLGAPRIAYQDYTSQHLKLAKRNGGGSWQLEIVDDGDWRGADTSLVVDRNGRMTIAYFDGLNNDVLSARWDGQSWTKGVVADAGANGYFNNVVLDAADAPIFGWYSFTGTEFFAKSAP